MKFIQDGMLVKSGRFTGRVTATIMGDGRPGWRKTAYYRIQLTTPTHLFGQYLILRLDKIEKASWEKL